LTLSITGDAANVLTPPLLSRRRFYSVMAVLLLVEILFALEHTMVMSVLPAVGRELKDVARAGWLVSIFGLAAAATAAIGGRLGDLYGRRRMLVVVTSLCALGSLISAFAPTFEGIIIGRAFQGASGAILPLCYGTIRQIAPRGRAPFWIGLLTGGYAFSSIFGYVLGGYFADRGDWSSIFMLTALISAISIPLLLLLLPKLPGAGGSGRIDILGAVLFAPAVAAVLFGVTMAKQWGWASADTWSVVGAGLAVLAFWAWYEFRHANPLINVRLLGNRKILVGNLCSIFTAAGLANLPIVFMMLLQQDPAVAAVGLGVSATLAGTLKIPSNVLALVGASLGGWLSGAQGARWAAFAGGIIGAVSWTGLMLHHDTIWQLMLWGIGCAFGSSVLMSALPLMVLEGTPKARSSETTGLTATIRSLATAVGAQIITVILASVTVVDPSSGTRLPTEKAYATVMILIASGALLTGLLALAAGRRRPGVDEEV
jgi:MFS family permease